jgi:hypothetical protein
MKKRKKRKRKKTYELTAALRLVFVSGKAQRAQIQEPLVLVNKRFQTCKERESRGVVSGEKKKGKPLAPRG